MLEVAKSAIDLAPFTLEGDLVRLEPLRAEHVDGLCAVGLDPCLWRYVLARVERRADLEQYVATAQAEQDAGTALPFATIWRATGQVIGSTRFLNAAPAHRRVEIGWTWVARPWQRTGVNTEAKYLMLRHAFERWGCLRVEFKANALNEQSRAAIRRLGAQEEGLLRRHAISERGIVRGTVFYSILEDEWPAVRQRLERWLANPPR